MEKENKQNFNRRDFLSRSISGMAGVGLIGLQPDLLRSFEQEKAAQDSDKKIIHRTLGKTGIRMPIVSMGVMNTMDPALVKRSYEIGIRHFDTAVNYQRGRNEEMVGNVINEMGVRDKVIIGTKIYIPHKQRDMSAKEAKKTYLKIADESLKRLQTDYIDILYSHNVRTMDWLNNPGILEALQLLKEQKKVRAIGFSTHMNMTECINNAVQSEAYDVILTSFNYAMSNEKELISAIKKAASKGIGLVAMKTQCSQYWYRENLPEEKQKFYKDVMHTAVLKWALRNDFITTAIPGYTTFQQMDEDFSVAYGLDYTSEEKQFLKDRNVKLSMGVCHQCNQCRATCPNDVDIPTLMRTHMYATCYTNFFQARDAIDSIDEGKGLEACSLCDVCTAQCINQIDIGKRIDELKLIYC